MKAHNLLFLALPLSAALTVGAVSAQWVAITPEETLVQTEGEFEDILLASDGGDGFVAIWDERETELEVGRHRGQGIDLSNLPSTDIFTTAEGESVNRPWVSPTGDGSLLVSWDVGVDTTCPAEEPRDCDYHQVYVQRFGGDGTALGERILVTDGAVDSPDRADEGRRSVVVAAGDGGFVVAWTDDLNQEIRIRAYSSNGTALGPYEVVVHHPESPVVPRPSIAERPGGGYTVAWVEYPGDESERRHWLRHVDASGRPTGEAVLITETHRLNSFGPRIAYGQDGRGLIAWLDAVDFDAPPGDPDRLVTRAILADGTLDPVVRGGHLDEDGLVYLKVVSLRDVDGYAVIWRSVDTQTLEARLFTADGEPVGEVSTLAPAQHDRIWDVLAAPQGELVAAWLRYGSVFNPATLSFQRFGPLCGGEILCLGLDERFRAQVSWRVEGGGEGRGTSRGRQTLDTGSFWFFNPDNIELVVKVLDGRPINGHFWVFYGGLSDVAFDLEITDTVTGRRALFQNPAGTLASRGDTEALPSIDGSARSTGLGRASASPPT